MARYVPAIVGSAFCRPGCSEDAYLATSLVYDIQDDVYQ